MSFLTVTKDKLSFGVQGRVSIMRVIALLGPSQCFQARTLLEWSRDELAGHAGISTTYLRDFEVGKRHPSDRVIAALRSALEEAGIEFTASNPPGVRQRQRP